MFIDLSRRLARQSKTTATSKADKQTLVAQVADLRDEQAEQKGFYLSILARMAVTP